MLSWDADFFRACLPASAWALERRLPEGAAPTLEQLRSAGRYFLAELPLFLDTPRIAGVSASVFCYHQVPAFLDDLFHHRLSLRPAEGQGFLGCRRGRHEQVIRETTTPSSRPERERARSTAVGTTGQRAAAAVRSPRTRDTLPSLGLHHRWQTAQATACP
ncbi:tRNA-dependent cyclodipeptide synthase [Streptomyces sp. NBC_00444]|uniref:tRNA-dependent cyclodipeptide synthase n=1 Tax=unclassified Streptomyces TaxID=2593676 RepID=UPI003FA6F85D